ARGRVEVGVGVEPDDDHAGVGARHLGQGRQRRGAAGERGDRPGAGGERLAEPVREPPEVRARRVELGLPAGPERRTRLRHRGHGHRQPGAQRVGQLRGRGDRGVVAVAGPADVADDGIRCGLCGPCGLCAHARLLRCPRVVPAPATVPKSPLPRSTPRTCVSERIPAVPPARPSGGPDTLAGMDALATLAAVGSSVVFCLLFAAVVRRVLGVPVSLVRAALAALAASFAANPLLAGLIGTPADDGRPDLALGLYLALVMVFAVVLAMLLLVVAEILVPDGSLPGPLELWRNGRARLARSRRYAQILRILAGRGLTRFLRGREPRASSSAERRELARSLRLALEEGGVAFVKLGQQLSTRRDLLPPEV